MKQQFAFFLRTFGPLIFNLLCPWAIKVTGSFIRLQMQFLQDLVLAIRQQYDEHEFASFDRPSLFIFCMYHKEDSFTKLSIWWVSIEIDLILGFYRKCLTFFVI